MTLNTTTEWLADKPIIASALLDIRFSTPNSELLPTAFETGVARKSHVWLTTLRQTDGTEHSLIAKLDDPARSHAEWTAIESLRRRPIQAMMPLPRNAEKHGVIIYENVSSHVHAGLVWPLREVLRRQLVSRPENCDAALDLLIDPLRLLYAAEPGASRSASKAGGPTWADAFSQVAAVRGVVSGDLDHKALSAGWRPLPDPVSALDAILADRCGNVLRSRVHGDLNLTNVLIGLSSAFQPYKLFLIDLADSQDYAVTAFDLARLETEFFYDVLAHLVQTEESIFDEARCVSTFMTMRDCLDGRIIVSWGDLPDVVQRSIAWLHKLRTQAFDISRSNLPDYRMQDYMVALYLLHLRSLGYPSVQASRFGRTIATLGAALALEYVTALQSGLDPPLPLGSQVDPDADPLGTPLRTWRRSFGPGALLRADYAIVPFWGREAELADLEGWATDHEPIAVRLYAGEGGLGKTRLALELCKRLRERGFRAGFLRHADPAALSQLLATQQAPAAPLVGIVDYADRQRDWISQLIREPLRAKHRRVRLILLARSAGVWWERLKRERDGVDDLLRATTPTGLEALAVPVDDRDDWFKRATVAFANKLERAVPTGDQRDLSAPHFERLLFIQMEALMSVEGASAAGGDAILDWMLDRERRSWDELVAANGLSSELASSFEQALAAVTLVKGVESQKEALALFKRLPFGDEPNSTISTIARILHENYGGRQWIEPLQPDLLGEHLVSKGMEGGLDGVLLQ